MGNRWHVTADERAEQILWVLQTAGEPLFYGQIAARLGLKKTSYLRAIIQSLEDAGHIEKSWVRLRNGVLAQQWAILEKKRRKS